MGEWKILISSLKEVNLDLILGSGQSFRWRKNSTGAWFGVFSNSLWQLKQGKDGNVKYCVKTSPVFAEPKSKFRKTSACDSDLASDIVTFDHEKVLRDYLQMDVHIEELYNMWANKNPIFQEVGEKYPGIRILRQDPMENLFSFICSSNNNISRITTMVGKLCETFGSHLLEENGVHYYAFPTVDSLAADGVEQQLREMGFGYRAKFISQTAQYLRKNVPPNWLHSLRNTEYRDAHSELLQLPGVGAKVADCVCLMSLDKPQAVPVDTHVWKITTSCFLPHLKSSKSLNGRIYNEVGDFFRAEFGEYAGWAQSVLFCSDLKKHKASLV